MTIPEMSWIFESVDAGTTRKTSRKNRVHSGNLMTPVANVRINGDDQSAIDEIIQSAFASHPVSRL